MKVLREIADFLMRFGELFPNHMYARGYCKSAAFFCFRFSSEKTPQILHLRRILSV